MFFGAGIPILFPIAFASLLSLYITERLCMAYVYQRPPIYTTALNNTVLKLLAFAPVPYVVVAAWVYSNQQVFRNTVVFNSENYLFPDPDHRLSQFWHQVTPGTLYLLALLCLTVQYAFSRAGCHLARSCQSDPLAWLKSEKNSEHRQSYFDTLNEGKLRSWYREEDSLLRNYGI